MSSKKFYIIYGCLVLIYLLEFCVSLYGFSVCLVNPYHVFDRQVTDYIDPNTELLGLIDTTFGYYMLNAGLSAIVVLVIIRIFSGLETKYDPKILGCAGMSQMIYHFNLFLFNLSVWLSGLFQPSHLWFDSSYHLIVAFIWLVPVCQYLFGPSRKKKTYFQV